MNPIAFCLLFSFITAVGAASHPECFAPGPACLRPQLSECRDALLKMRYTDPGYVTTFGRHLEWRRDSIDVPRVWQSFPRNCVVKLDTVTEMATDQFRLRTLTVPGQEVIAACITGGSHCGGAINVGPKKVMHLSIGHYSTTSSEQVIGGRPSNISLSRRPAAVALDNSPESDNDSAIS